MKKLLLFLISVYPLYLQAATLGVSATNRLIGQSTHTLTGGGSTTGGSTACACCASCPSPCATNTALPGFQIQMFSGTGTTPINTANINTPSNFTFATALLLVHIFPPSNTISSATSNPDIVGDSGGKNSPSYTVLYTLKSLDGTILEKSFQSNIPISTGTAAGTPVMMTGATAQIPTALAIYTVTTPTTGGTPTVSSSPITSNNGTPGPIPFLPSLTNLSNSPGSIQQILNGMSPICQKFLITSSGTGTSATYTATPISGIFDTEDGSTLSAAILNAAGSTTVAPSTVTTYIQPITVTLSSSPITPGATAATSGSSFTQFQFLKQGSSKAAAKIPFTTQDLANGIALNLHIFPPSTSPGTTPTNYVIIATLRTLDGLKLHKMVLPGQTFSSPPAYFSINYGPNPYSGATSTTLSATIINTGMTTGQAYNLISPMNLRCLLQTNTINNTTAISIL